jgi:hypothetical protein
MIPLDKIRKEGADAEPSPDDPAFMRWLRRMKWGPDRGRWAWLLSHFWAEKDPTTDHWEAAEAALEKEEHNPADDEARRKLGFALVGLWREIFPRLWTDDDMGSPATKIVQKHGFKVVKQTSILADEIEARFGASGKETSRYMLAAAHERWAQAPLPLPHDEPQLNRDRAAWSLWTDHIDEGNPSPILVILARLLWPRVKEELEAEKKSLERGLVVRGYTDEKGDRYAGMGKVTDGLTWALGGAGIQVDSDTYTAEPDIAARFLPPAALEIPELRSGQRAFPFALEGADLPPEVQTSGLTPTIIRPTAAKLVVLALAAARQTGSLILCTLEDLTRYINQGQKYRGAMCKRTAKALREMDRLKFVFPDDTEARVFSDVRHPRGKPTPDQVVGWAPGRMVRGAIRHGVKDGWFLINLSGIMRMKGNQHVHDLRLYLLAASDWNRLRMAGKEPSATLEQWGARANMLTPNAARYAAGDRRNRGSGRLRLHEGRKKTQAAFERLDGAGLIKIEKRGKLWIPSQPEAHRAARENIRKRGLRDD